MKNFVLTIEKNSKLIDLSDAEVREIRGGDGITRAVFYYIGRANKAISDWVNDPKRMDLSTGV
ncbi:MAG: hypothetical protein EAZ15_09870 [Sphingobacteriales bacterium]|nr:MAG: hypothetical protein EAZ15_09870 [Sphingobacteriales bacterium]